MYGTMRTLPAIVFMSHQSGVMVRKDILVIFSKLWHNSRILELQ